MHEHIVKMQMWCNAWTFRIIYTKPIPKISPKLHQFRKTPKKFQKPKNRGLMHEEWRIKDPYQRRKAWSRLKSKWGRWRGRVRSVWERNKRVSVERDRWEMKKIALMLYIEKHEARWIKRYWEVSSFKFSPDKAIKELSRGVHSKVTSMDWEAIEHLSSI